jgi:hypothetical protein
MKSNLLFVGCGSLLASALANAPPWLLVNASNTEMSGLVLLWWLGATFLVATVGTYSARGAFLQRFAVVAVAAFMGVHIVVMLRILIDFSSDPTSHNLAPFEFIVAAFPAGFGVIAGSALGLAIGQIAGRGRPLSQSSVVNATRHWASDDGSFQVEAELVTYDGQMAELKRVDGSTISVPISMLSEIDREFLYNGQRRNLDFRA